MSYKSLRYTSTLLLFLLTAFSPYGKAAEINPNLTDTAKLFSIAADMEESPLTREVAEKLLRAKGVEILSLLREKLQDPADGSMSTQLALRLLGQVGKVNDEKIIFAFCKSENIFIRDKALMALTSLYRQLELPDIISRQSVSFGSMAGIKENVTMAEGVVLRNIAVWEALTLAAEERKEVFSLESLSGASPATGKRDVFTSILSAVPDAALRQAVVAALGFCHERELAGGILAAMLATDPASTVRAACAHALGLMPVQDVAVLVKATEDENDIVCLEAAAALVRWGATEDGLDILHKALLLSEDDTNEAQKRAQELLGEAGGGKIYSIGGGAGLRRLHALALLEELAQPQSEEPLIYLLSSPQWRIRAEAARIIGLLQGSGITHELQNLLEDPHPTVRAEAAIALARQGALGIQWRVAKWLEHPNPLFRAEAARVLGRILAVGLLVDLARMVSDDSLQVAVAATGALGNFTSEKEEVTALLNAALSDRRVAVAGTAALEMAEVAELDIKTILASGSGSSK